MLQMHRQHESIRSVDSIVLSIFLGEESGERPKFSSYLPAIYTEQCEPSRSFFVVFNEPMNLVLTQIARAYHRHHSSKATLSKTKLWTQGLTGLSAWKTPLLAGARIIDAVGRLTACVKLCVWMMLISAMPLRGNSKTYQSHVRVIPAMSTN